MYRDEEKRRQTRMGPYELIEEVMDEWDKQSDLMSTMKPEANNYTVVDNNVRKEKTNKLQ